jgi:hypothetical protein
MVGKITTLPNVSFGFIKMFGKIGEKGRKVPDEVLGGYCRGTRGLRVLGGYCRGVGNGHV